MTQSLSGFQSIFGIVSVITIGIMLLVAVAVIVIILSVLKRSSKNRNSPRLDTHATVLGKRTSYSRHHDHHRTAFYYVTFEFDSGDRMEFRISGSDYGLMFEGDQGVLTFQGTRFISFVRKTR